MYHTEGFINKESYFTGGHMYSFAMGQGEQVCYFWCVLYKYTGISKRNLREGLDLWLKQTLLFELSKGSVYVQKELNRLGTYLTERGMLYGIEETPQLFLYAGGTLYRFGEELFVVKQKRRKGCFTRLKDSCVYVSPRLWAMSEVKGAVKSGQCEKRELANSLEVLMCRGQSSGELERGFFMVWEKQDAI